VHYCSYPRLRVGPLSVLFTRVNLVLKPTRLQEQNFPARDSSPTHTKLKEQRLSTRSCRHKWPSERKERKHIMPAQRIMTSVLLRFYNDIHESNIKGEIQSWAKNSLTFARALPASHACRHTSSVPFPVPWLEKGRKKES
jgi:hypothetical protein